MSGTEANSKRVLSPRERRQRRNEEGPTRRPVTQDHYQHSQPQVQGEHRLQQLCGDTACSHALIG